MNNYTQKLWLTIFMLLTVGLAACGGSPAPLAQPVTVQETQREAAVPPQQTDPTATPETTGDEAAEVETLISPAETQSEMAAGASASQQFGLVVSQLNDKGFNDLAWAGMQRAAEELGVTVQFAQDTNPATAQNRITQFINHGFDGLVAVGLEYGPAIKATGQMTSTIPLAIVDFPNQTAHDRGLLFEVDAPAFLAGYLAAGMSQSGTVCTYGGQKIPPVLIFMVGFEHGIEYYNDQNEASVALLGWHTDPSTPSGGEGVFAGNFSNQSFGRQIAQELAGQGCDIIFPVAGAVGLGTAEVAADNGLTLIGVDADQSLSNSAYADLYLTSVIKHVDQAVFETISLMATGDFAGGNNYIGTLDNRGVGLAPFHSFEEQVPQSLKDQLFTVEQDLVLGKLTTGWPIGAGQIETSLTSGSLNLVALRNTTYDVVYTQNGTAPLANGQYLETTAEGAVDIVVTLGGQVAYGDLDGDGQEEAVVIVVSDPNGSAIFHDLAVVADQDGTPVNLASAALPDPVVVKEVDVEGGLVKVVMDTVGPGDGQCCPSQHTVSFYGLQNGALVALASQTVD